MLLRRPNGQCWVLKQALSRLRVSVEWFSDPRRIEREAAGMRRLWELAPAGSITQLIFLDPEHHLLAMDAVPQPHENWKRLLLAGEVDADHFAQFGHLLGSIHRKASQGAQSLSQEFEDRSFFESLRLEPYYLYAAEQTPAAAGFLRDLVRTTRAARYTLVHGDYSPKNVLVREGRLVLLDHEVIHFGDGAFDLGFSLAHLLSKAHHLPARRSNLAAAVMVYWRTYHKEIGAVSWSADVEPRGVAHALGCLLARCRGRSPLEYLDAEERQTQCRAVTSIVQNPPRTIERLLEQFLKHVSLPHGGAG